MLGTIINVVLVLAGSILGLIFKNRISTRFASGLNYALGLCVLGIGISSMIKTNDTLCVIVCMVVGTLAGEALNIERRMDGIGEVLRRKMIKGEGNNRFVEGFVTASVLFCVGAMAINGSLEAGMSQKYDILISKAVIDGGDLHHLCRGHGCGGSVFCDSNPDLRGGDDPSLLCSGGRGSPLR